MADKKRPDKDLAEKYLWSEGDLVTYQGDFSDMTREEARRILSDKMSDPVEEDRESPDPE